MKIALLQLDIAPGKRQMNQQNVQKKVRLAAQKGAQLAVLPELWDTSFYPENIYDLADDEGKEARNFLTNLARTQHIALVAGSITRRHANKLYNTTYVVDEQGQLISSYDKCHLFAPGKEDLAFTPGSHVHAFSLLGVPMASVTCYDLRFCEWVRMAALTGAKILFVPAAWPTTRLSHWQILNRARAIENQFFVMAVNSCGICGDFHFAGHSLAVDPWGEVLAEAKNEEEILLVDVDLSVIEGIRKSINVFHDRRPALYQL